MSIYNAIDRILEKGWQNPEPLEPEPEPEPKEVGGIIRAIKRGGPLLAAEFAGLGAAVADMPEWLTDKFGHDPYGEAAKQRKEDMTIIEGPEDYQPDKPGNVVSNKLLELSTNIKKYAEETFPREFQSYKEIKDFSGFGRWFFEQVGEQAPMMLASLGAGWVARAAKLGKAGIYAAYGLPTAAEVGGGAYTEMGDSRDPAAAIGAGAIGMMLEVVPGADQLRRMGLLNKFQSQVAKNIKRDPFLKSVFKAIGTQSIKEGITEAPQEFVQLAAVYTADKDKDLFGPEFIAEVVPRMKNAFVSAAAVGGFYGGGSQVASRTFGLDKQPAAQPERLATEKPDAAERAWSMIERGTPDAEGWIYLPTENKEMATKLQTELADFIVAKNEGINVELQTTPDGQLRVREAIPPLSEGRERGGVVPAVKELVREKMSVDYDPDRVVTMKTLIDDEDRPAVTEESYKQMLVDHGLPENIDPAEIAILGENTDTQIYLHKDASVYDVVEEVFEQNWAQTDDQTRNEVRSQFKEYETMNGKLSEGNELERLSDLVKAAALDQKLHRKLGFKLRELVTRFRGHIHDLLGKSRKLRQQIRDGKVSDKFLKSLHDVLYAQKEGQAVAEAKEVVPVPKKKVPVPKKEKIGFPKTELQREGIISQRMESERLKYKNNVIKAIEQNRELPEYETDEDLRARIELEQEEQEKKIGGYQRIQSEKLKLQQRIAEIELEEEKQRSAILTDRLRNIEARRKAGEDFDENDLPFPERIETESQANKRRYQQASSELYPPKPVTKKKVPVPKKAVTESGGIKPEQQAAQPTAGPPVVEPSVTPEAKPGEKAALVKPLMSYIHAVKNANGKYEVEMGTKAPDNPFTNEIFTGEFDTAQIARKSYEAWFYKQQSQTAKESSAQKKLPIPRRQSLIFRPKETLGEKAADPQITILNGTVSAIVREPISAGTKAGNEFLARTKGITKIGPPGVLRRIASGVATFAKEFHFLANIPKTKEFGNVREKFRQAMEIASQATKDANLAMKKALAPTKGTLPEMTKRIQSVELKLIADDLYESVVQGTELPPPGVTKDDIIAMKKEADALYDKYPTVKEAYDSVREETKKIADLIVEQGWFPAEKMKNFYAPHKVLKYLRNHDDYFGVSNKPSTPKKAYLRKRKGGVDYATDVLERLRRHWALVRRDVELSKFLDTTLKSEQAEHFDKEFPDWDREVDDMPEGYEEYTLLPPRFYYSTYGVTEDLAMALLEQNLNTIEDVLLEPSARSKVRKILGVGKKRSYIVRSPIAAQLADMPTVVLGDNGIYKAIKAGNTFIKGQILFNPLYAIPFHSTNFIGDAHKVLITLPSALESKYLIGYAKEVIAAVRGNQSFLFHKSQTTGVCGAGWVGTELGELEAMITELEKTSISSGKALNKIKRLWNMTRDFGAGREDLLRFCLFSRLIDLQNQGTDIIKYAIKDVDAVRGITDSYDKAAKIARDIMGDYSAIGKSGRMLSDLLIPFYRWMHLNTPWWPRMLKEYAKKGQYGRIAYAISTTLVPSILATIWNYGDEDRRKTEESLPPWRRWNLHVVIGKNKVLSVPMPFDDMLNFFGIPEHIVDFQRYSRGMININELIKRIAINTAKEPGMSVINSIGGVAGIIRNAIGLQTFPDIKPYLITDPKLKAVNISKTVFGAPGQLAETYLREGQEQKRKDLLWRSVIPFFRPWTNDIYKIQDQLKKSTYQQTSKKGQPHKGKARQVDILRMQLKDRSRKKVP